MKPVIKMNNSDISNNGYRLLNPPPPFWIKRFTHIILSSSEFYEFSASALRMRDWESEKAVLLDQGHKARKWQSLDLNPALVALKHTIFPLSLQ